MTEICSPAKPPLRIGTRRSNLAIVQTEGIRDRLQKIVPERTYKIETLLTLGGRDKSTALYDFNAKSLWTTELEDKLTSGQLDVIVHCLKGETSLPAILPLSSHHFPLGLHSELSLCGTE
jgi:hydroxymethylbilane synthase